jgi:hypothetical protein
MIAWRALRLTLIVFVLLCIVMTLMAVLLGTGVGEPSRVISRKAVAPGRGRLLPWRVMAVGVIGVLWGRADFVCRSPNQSNVDGASLYLTISSTISLGVYMPNHWDCYVLLLRERLGSPPNSQRLAPDLGPLSSAGAILSFVGL